MKNYLYHYLLKLPRSGAGLAFHSIACSYGEFTMYCLVGPEENIVQITFAPERHEYLKIQLKRLHKEVYITELPQHEFQHDTMFQDYFTGKRSVFPIPPESPLLAGGTDFQQRIWHHIRAIPYGSKITYRELAELAGSPKGSRAAGTACGANPLAVVIPCHRVVAQNGLGAFAGGVHIKSALLALEQTGINSD